MKNYDDSVLQMWNDFVMLNPEYRDTKFTAWFFCDNKNCADELAGLVVKGEKRATASLFYWYDSGKEEMPVIGNISIITDWDGIAKCIIKTKSVTKIPFKNVNSEMAFTEGEGDKTLDYWRKAHISFFTRESETENIEFTGDTLIVFEEFELVFK